MSDDIVDRLLDDTRGRQFVRAAADEIVRLRTRVAELEADKRAQAACMDANGAHYAQELSFWQDLADQLAEALRRPCWPCEQAPTPEHECQTEAALAAYDRARTPATQEPT